MGKTICQFTKLYPEWLNPKLFDLTEKYSFIDKAFFITDSKDLIAIHTHGHTKGSISILLITDNGIFAFVGDVCYSQDQLLNNTSPGVNLSASETL